MTCNEARQLWDLYHDSEGESEFHFSINEHLKKCSACARWFAAQSQLEDRLAKKLSAQPASVPLWESILQKTNLRPASPQVRWRWLAGVAAGILLALALGVWLIFWPGNAGGDDLADLSANFHQKLMDGKVTIAFASNSDPQVEAYLRNRVAFPVRCPPRKDAGFAVQGAGDCKLAQQAIAYLFGKVDGAPVSIIVLAKESLQHFPQQHAVVSPRHVHHCRQGPYHLVMGVIDRNVVVVIGDTPADRLERVLRAYGTYPHVKG